MSSPEGDRWLLRQQSALLRQMRDDARGLWNDSASRHVEERYLRSHDTAASEMMRWLELQSAQLDSAGRYVDTVRQHRLRATHHTERVVEEVARAAQDTSALHEHVRQALIEEARATELEHQALELVQQANLVGHRAMSDLTTESGESAH